MTSWCAFVLGVIGESCCDHSFKQFAKMTEETIWQSRGGALGGWVFSGLVNHGDVALDDKCLFIFFH